MENHGVDGNLPTIRVENMDFGLSKEEIEIRAEVREFIEREATPALREESQELEHIYGGPEGRKFYKKFGAKGWITPSWPREYGGIGSSETITYIIRDELAYAGIPFQFAGAHFVGPSILRNGSEEQKKKYLLPLAQGEIEFALGYSEPSAGSDLMSLEIRAEDKGDHFLVNGQKTFNTHAHVADYHWLACRTNVDAPRHKGISILIVDLKTEGITIRPMITLAGSRTNEVYYNNVKVPKENLVGEINAGLKYIMVALDFERMFPFGHYKRFFENLVQYAKTTEVDGSPLSKDPIVRQKLAQLEIDVNVLELLYYQLAHILDSGKVPSYQASMEKIFFSEFAQRLSHVALEIMGPQGLVKMGDPRAPMNGMADYLYRWTIIENIYGGTSEIQRNIIAQRGLGLPRES
jgi:alkylation response protein AidB-like acyl-CoA dehydrogenase